MAATFLAIFPPMLVLFTCIALGFILHKVKILPDSAGQVMAKLETYLFCPALSFSTMATFCTPQTIRSHAINLSVGIVSVSLAVLISLFLVRFFVRQKNAERGVYTYALAFANSGYMGDPLIQMLLGDAALSYYKLFCLPINTVIYIWGINILVPNENKTGGLLKKILNPSTVAMLLGMLVGLTGIHVYLPSFITGSLDSLKLCMGPVAMLLAGFTIASYPVGEILKIKKVYIVSLLRLTAIPAVLIAALFGFKELLALCLHQSISNDVLYFAFFATATPLGLNTIVFPEAYGGNPKTGASMALISHALCILSIPFAYALLSLIFGPFRGL